MSEHIHIQYIEDVVDNWGRTEIYHDESEIIKILKDEESWTDDLTFVDYSNKRHSLDDLMDKIVRVGGYELLVLEGGAVERKRKQHEDIEEEPDETTKKILEEIHKIIDPTLKLKETLKELVKKYPNDVELGRSVRRLNLD